MTARGINAAVSTPHVVNSGIVFRSSSTVNASGDFNTDAVDEAVLALLYLSLHDGDRAWKGHDWDALDRLHPKGLIENPTNKTKSVVLTEEGLRESERLFQKHFGLSRREK